MKVIFENFDKPCTAINFLGKDIFKTDNGWIIKEVIGKDPTHMIITIANEEDSAQHLREVEEITKEDLEEYMEFCKAIEKILGVSSDS